MLFSYCKKCLKRWAVMCLTTKASNISASRPGDPVDPIYVKTSFLEPTAYTSSLSAKAHPLYSHHVSSTLSPPSNPPPPPPPPLPPPLNPPLPLENSPLFPPSHSPSTSSTSLLNNPPPLCNPHASPPQTAPTQKSPPPGQSGHRGTPATQGGLHQCADDEAQETKLGGTQSGQD